VAADSDIPLDSNPVALRDGADAAGSCAPGGAPVLTRIVRCGLLLVALVALVSAGCGGSESPPSGSPLSADELTWVRAYSVWSIEVYDEDLGAAPGAALVRECEKRVGGIGDAPTTRLRPAAERIPAVCPLLGARGTYRRGLDVIDAADDLILPFLLDSKELPLLSRVTNHSRADTRLSGLASDMADTPVEVRCWSAPDWRRFVGEENAWTDGDTDAADLYGRQDDDTSRIHMRLRQCNRLLSLKHAEILSWSEDAQSEAADSMVTLAHEIQHFVQPDAEEADVECGAARTLMRVARRLGADADEAQALLEIYRDELYPELPQDYVKATGCNS
jgi:hypothetical protein